jgi:hypothetical protein
MDVGKVAYAFIYYCYQDGNNIKDHLMAWRLKVKG